MSVLEIKDLHVAIDDKEILKGVNLEMKTAKSTPSWDQMGLVTSTLSAAIMGNPNYEVTKGEILFEWKKYLRLGSRRTRTFRVILSDAISKRNPGNQ